MKGPKNLLEPSPWGLHPRPKAQGDIARSDAQQASVVIDVVLHEGCDEIVAVVITRLDPAFQRNAGGLTGLFQEFGLQLLLQKRVCTALVHRLTLSYNITSARS